MIVNGDGVGVSGGGGVFVCLADCLPFRQDQGTVWPGSQSARVLLADSLRGANWPGSEKARYRTYGLAYIIEFTMAALRSRCRHSIYTARSYRSDIVVNNA